MKHQPPPVGTVLGERYRVVRLLGSGAYGVVLEVEHIHTRHHRAMKLLHPEAIENPEVVERFLRESSAAGRVGNSHIVETFDAGRFADGQPYLVMELLAGETVRSVLHRERQVGVGLACELVAQAATGIHAAHLAGIVHRDLKPDNLYVATGPSVKILDFGVSRFSESDQVSLTQSRAPMGTPVYMAPEIFKGAKDAGPAVDVYALGVMLYELLCGSVPFEAPSYGALAILVATTEARRLSERTLSIDPKLEAVVMRAMARDPRARFSTAEELAQALAPWRSTQGSPPLERTSEPSPIPADAEAPTFRGGERATPYQPSIVPASSSAPGSSAPASGASSSAAASSVGAAPATATRWLRAALLIAGLSLVVGATAAVLHARTPAEAPSTKRASSDGSITVFRSARGADWRASLAAEVLHRSLALTGAKLTPLADAESFRSAQDAWPPDFLGAAELERTAQAFGSPSVVTVEAVATPPTLRVVLYTAEAQGKVLTQAITGDDVTAAALALAPQVRALLARPPPNPADEQALAGALPHAAAEQYQQGLEQLRLMNLRDARDLLERAAKADPTNALIQSALARTYDLAGQDAQGLAAAQEAARLAEAGSPRSVQLGIACQVAALSFEARAVDDSCGANALAHPDSLEHRLAYVDALKRTDQWKKAEEQLRAAPPSQRSDPRLLLLLAEVLSQQGRFDEEATVATEAVTQARARRANWLEAAANLKKCDALRGKGELAAAWEVCDTARRLFLVPKDYEGQARAQTALGHILAASKGLDAGVGDGATASAAYAEAIVLAKKAGSLRDEVDAMKHVSDVQLEEGKVDEARQTLQRALAEAVEIRSASSQSLVAQALGSLELSEGRLPQGLEYFEQATESARAAHLVPHETLALAGLGAVEWELGKLSAARTHLERALELARKLGDRVTEQFAAETLADVFSELHQPAEARATLDAAVRAAAHPSEVDAVRFELSQVRHDFEAGELDASRAAAVAARGTGCDGAVALALWWLAAPPQVELAPRVLAAASDCEPRDGLWIRIAVAEAWQRAGRTAEARRAVAKTRAEATAHGWKDLELWAALVEARVSAKPAVEAAKVAAAATADGQLALAARANGGRPGSSDAGR